MTFTNPRVILAMLKVMIKGGRESLVIRTPLRIPINVPKPRQMAMAGAVGMPLAANHEIIILDRPSV
jgi:hypothetical protein